MSTWFYYEFELELRRWLGGMNTAVWAPPVLLRLTITPNVTAWEEGDVEWTLSDIETATHPGERWVSVMGASTTDHWSEAIAREVIMTLGRADSLFTAARAYRNQRLISVIDDRVAEFMRCEWDDEPDVHEFHDAA